MGGMPAARPAEGARFKAGETEFRFQHLSEQAIIPHPIPSRQMQSIALPTGGPRSACLLYGLLKVESPTVLSFDPLYQIPGGQAECWFNGRLSTPQELLFLAPGLHRILVKAKGRFFVPRFFQTDTEMSLAKQRKFEWLMARYQEARAEHARSGLLCKPKLVLDWCRLGGRYEITRRPVFGEGPRGQGRGDDFVLYPLAYHGWMATGEGFFPDLPFPWELEPPALAAKAKDFVLPFLASIAPESYKRALVQEFLSRSSPENLRKIPCRALVAAFTGLPWDLIPLQPNGY
jgi:hypothetical protein